MTIYKVYKITNRLNGKLYVGQTQQALEKRFTQHFYANSPLGRAMRQCGAENFTIEVIEYCESKKQLNERERFWINVLNCKVPNGYNVSDGGSGNNYAHKAISENTGMTTAESFKRFRKAFKLTRAEVAETLGIKTISYDYENGDKKTNPTAKTLLKLANKYNVSVDYLLGLTDNPRPPKQSQASEPQPQANTEIQTLNAHLENIEKISADILTDVQQVNARFERIENLLLELLNR